MLAVDIETACNVGCEKECRHALDFNRSRITVVGVYGKLVSGEIVKRTFRSLNDFADYVHSLPHNVGIIGQGFKFDIKNLWAKGVDIPLKRWKGDTQLMGVASTTKVPDWWLEKYEERRKEENKVIKGTHRPGSKHSLKTMAPYFLKVDPFWEDPTNHDNDEYVLKDCEYTYKLWEYFNEKMSQSEKLFYENKLLPWTKMLTNMEYRGVAIDLEALEREDTKAKLSSIDAKSSLDGEWSRLYDEYHEMKCYEVNAKYNEMRNKRWAIMKSHLKSPARWQKLILQYEKSKERAIEKIEPLNLDSPAQLTWLLKYGLKLNIARQDNGEESTGKNVLERLASEGRDDVKTFLTYRKQRKLTTAFFPSYRTMHHNGIMHTNFNPSGTRTGRLSSDNPNLQQVPGSLHKLFRARDGYKLFCVDQSAIEARLIALYTEDPILYDVITEGKSIHDVNAKIFFSLDCHHSDVKANFPKERQAAKNCGFALFYGAGWRRIQFTAMQAGFTLTEYACKEIYSNFKETYKQAFHFKRKVLDPLLARGEVVNNLLGRPINVENPDEVHMKGFNKLIQSSASDLVLDGGEKQEKEFANRDWDARPLLFIHDEIVGEFNEKLDDSEVMDVVRHSMTGYKLNNTLGPIPLEVEGGVSQIWTK